MSRERGDCSGREAARAPETRHPNVRLTPPVRHAIVQRVTDSPGAQIQPETASLQAASGPRVTPLGVVDPMRLPIPAGVARWWTALPGLGRVFVGLAAIDVIGRVAGLLDPPFSLDLGDPILLLAQLFPRTLVILLPALILSRRPDAAEATPLVVRGAVIVAFVELVAPQVTTGGFRSLGPENIVVWTLLSLIAVLAKAWAWVTIGRGLLALSPPAPSPNVAGFANLVAGALGALALVNLVLNLFGPQISLWDPASDGLYRLASTLFVIESFALAFLGRIVIRGFADPRRPPQATRLAATAFGVVGVVALLDVALGLATLFRTSFGLEFIPVFGPDAPGMVFAYISFLGGWFASGLMTSAFLASFALGLADTSDRTASDEPPPDNGPSWPEAGDPASWPRPEHRPSR